MIGMSPIKKPFEPNNSEEEVPTSTQKPVQLSDFEEADDTTVPVIFRMPKTTYKRLGQIALDRETSRVALVREAIKEYLKTLEKPTEQKIIIPDRQLDRILESCMKEAGLFSNGGFVIAGENGFIDSMEAKGFKLKDLTPNQWKKVKEYINVRVDCADLEELSEKLEVLEPSEKQATWLSGKEEPEEEAEEK